MASLREKIHEVIFEAETPSGRAFDFILLWGIVLSVLCVILESVPEYGERYGSLFLTMEWGFTVLFTLEYLLRLFCVKKPWHYVFSFYGLVDLLATVPTYLALYFTGAHSLLIIRSLRFLRVFRLLKLGRYMGEANTIFDALKASRIKIIVFLVAVLSIVLIMGTVMYMVEGAEHGFNSIPRGIYWAIVTITTVGYGDLAPQTSTGQFLASFMMVMGYGIIAVPTGIVSAEMVRAERNSIVNTISCPDCMLEGHDSKAKFCRACGSGLSF